MKNMFTFVPLCLFEQVSLENLGKAQDMIRLFSMEYGRQDTWLTYLSSRRSCCLGNLFVRTCYSEKDIDGERARLWSEDVLGLTP